MVHESNSKRPCWYCLVGLVPIFSKGRNSTVSHHAYPLRPMKSEILDFFRQISDGVKDSHTLICLLHYIIGLLLDAIQI